MIEEFKEEIKSPSISLERDKIYDILMKYVGLGMKWEEMYECWNDIYKAHEQTNSYTEEHYELYGDYGEIICESVSPNYDRYWIFHKDYIRMKSYSLEVVIDGDLPERIKNVVLKPVSETPNGKAIFRGKFRMFPDDFTYENVSLWTKRILEEANISEYEIVIRQCV
jgi:hypothetical protein